MAGPRKWRFVPRGSPSGTYSEETEFWIEWDTSPNHGMLSLRVKEVWKKITPSSPYVDRVAVEDRTLHLLDMPDRYGTLYIDEGFGSPHTYSNVKCTQFEQLQNSNNVMLEYTMHFEVPKPSWLTARSLVLTPYDTGGREPLGTGVSITADLFIVTTSQVDRTQFLESYRNALVRIPAGPPLKTYQITGVRQIITGISEDTNDWLQRRLKVEALIDTLQSNIGRMFTLILDSQNLGVVHFNNVIEGEKVPDAATYDMTLFGNFVRG